jgi:Cu-Zn family superoxide dismutase
VRRITKAALGGVAGFALVLGGTQVAVGSLEGTYKFFRDNLVDPEPPFTNDGAFDSAKAKTTITQTTDGTTTFAIRVTGIDPSVEGAQFGAHLHVGECVKTGGHYQHVVGTGPAWINPHNEVWLGLEPDVEGMALGRTTVTFVPDDDKYPEHSPGKMSIVIHKGPLDAPGAKQACFPLSVPQWADGV